MTFVILSRDGRFRATVADGPDGVEIELWRAAIIDDGAGSVMWRRLERGPLDVPLHVALDLVYAEIWPMDRERRLTMPR